MGPDDGNPHHVGRRSGKQYRTPLTVYSTNDGVAILLTYGPDRDWLKNITAAGGGTIRRYGRSFSVHNPQVMTKAEAAPRVTGVMKAVFPLLPFEQAVLLRRG